MIMTPSKITILREGDGFRADHEDSLALGKWLKSSIQLCTIRSQSFLT
jgi:hypothetical protein